MVKANKSKLVKVIFEFEDGEVRSLGGDVAQRWLKELDGLCVMAWNHGNEFSPYEWTIEKEVNK